MNHPPRDGSDFGSVQGDDVPALPAAAPGADRPTGTADHRLVIKAALDRFAAALLLLLTGVWLLLISAAVWLESPGPLFAREPRLGCQGRPFHLLRFRTTVLDLPPGGTTSAPYDSDAVMRVRTPTRVGRILERYCLDELPQLINVLRGEMALVGPRPQDPRRIAAQGSDAPAPLPVKPGLTGLHGAGPRSGSGATVPMAVDDYVRHYSFGLDLIILGRAALLAVERQRRLTGRSD